jgi:tellurite methyltransferase
MNVHGPMQPRRAGLTPTNDTSAQITPWRCSPDRAGGPRRWGGRSWSEETRPRDAPSTLGAVERTIIGYHGDEAGDWIAELSCGHNQHVRHRPPFQLRAWTLEDKGRTERLGTPLDCPLCDRAELPEGLHLVRTSPVWDELNMPRGLLRAHRVASGTWGRIVVQDGRLLFTASTEPAIEVELVSGSSQAIPPDVEHSVQPLGPVRFSVEFFAMERGSGPGETDDAQTSESNQISVLDEGGDPACWAGLLCVECGVVLDGGPHREDCSLAASSSFLD